MLQPYRFRFPMPWIGQKGGFVPTWWNLNGAIATATGAYQSIGAASFADSLVNRANPGTYDATVGNAPAWAAGTGWTFDGVNDYLKTGIVINAFLTWTVVVQFSGAVQLGAANFLAGVRFDDFGGGQRFIGVIPQGTAIAGAAYANGYQPGVQAVAKYVAGNMAVAGTDGYYNGVDVVNVTVAADAPSGAYDLYIGARNERGAGPVLYYQGNITAVSVYNYTLTAPNMLALAARMAAL